MPTYCKVLIAVALLVFFALLAWDAQRTLEIGLPPRIECRNFIEALQQASHHATDTGGQMVPVLGTGSMAPYIPAAAPGLDPKATVVAFVVTDPDATYEDIEPGTLCLYAAGWNPALTALHGAAMKDSGGWIMSGLHNARSEPQWRVTPASFRGIAARVYTWPQP